MDFFIGLVVWLNLAGEPVHTEVLGYAKQDVTICQTNVAKALLSPENIEVTKKAVAAGLEPKIVCVKTPERAPAGTPGIPNFPVVPPTKKGILT